jgi:two-component system CheB/CheR fusion protein
MDVATTTSTMPAAADQPVLVVGLGASAGGLESLEQFFAHTPVDSGLAFVVIQHLSPNFPSMMDELLARHTSLPLHRAEEGMQVAPNHVYLLPPKKEMTVRQGRLHLIDKDPKLGLSLPIDHFFRSLAAECGPRAVAVVLSGTGSDGSRGVVDVHEAGGLVVAEDGSSASFDGMPLSAQATGCVDLVLPAAQIPAVLLEHLRVPQQVRQPPPPAESQPAFDIEAVFELLRERHDIDFSHYKPTTVGRRIERRLPIVRAANLKDYIGRLRQDPEELNALYHDLLIGVTEFFRDAQPFHWLQRQLLPQLLQRVPPAEELRLWVAGCATGEEAYSLAILFHEALEAARRPINMKVFATDVHQASLEQAGRAIYDPQRLAGVPADRLRRYFNRRRNRFQVSQELRQLIVFARHNLIKDAPFTNLDLISCRNLLIYFQPQAQTKAVSFLHFGLKSGGTLMLGSSETPGALSDEFDTLHESYRLYRKRRDVRLPTELRLPAARGGRRPAPPPTLPSRGATPHAGRNLSAVHERLLDRFMPPSLLINEHREVVESFGGAEKLLRIKGRRVSHDLLDLLDTETDTTILAALHRVMRHGQPLSFSGVRLKQGDQQQTFRIHIEPTLDDQTAPRHYLIALEPLGETHPATGTSPDVDVNEMTHDQVRHLEEELRYTKENLQATIEELETSNEEMQATNEELVASNEELQSTNEELHSVNEELYTVNAEHQKKIDELAELNRDMEHLLRTTDMAIVFLDRDLCIRRFTPRVAEIFDLVDQDLGRRISTFSHSICHGHLMEELQAVLDDGIARESEVRDVRNRVYFMRMLPYCVDNEIRGVVLALIDISVLDAARSQILHLSAIVESSEDGIIGFDLAGRITSWNAGAERLYDYTSKEAVGRDISIIVPREQLAETRRRFEQVRRGVHLDPMEVDRLTKEGQRIHVSLALSPIKGLDGAVVGVSGISRDISVRRQAEEARAYLSAIVKSSDDAIIGATLDGEVTSWNRGAERLFGYRGQEIVGRTMAHLVPPDRSNEVPDILRQVSRGELVEHFETIRVRRDGSQIDVSLTISPINDSQGRLIGASMIARDITPLKATLRERDAGEQRIRLLLDSTAEAIYGLDNTGTCIFVNPACGRLLGYDSADELLGQKLHDLIHHSHPDGGRASVEDCQICQSYLRGRRVHCEEAIAWRKDGTSFHAEVWSHPMVAPDGRSIGAVVTFLDITERKEAVETLREEARRREQFLAMLSHELRNPLSAIRTAARLLTRPDVQPAADAEARHVIDRQTSQMTRLLDDLLDVSRITQDKIHLDQSPIDLRETLDDAVQSVRSLASDCGVEIDVVVSADRLLVNGDVTRLEQIQANLLSNAIKYSSRGQRVRIELASDPHSAIIRVTDSGAGIAPDMLDRIFDIFVQVDDTLDRARGGMGVGLTLVRKLVDLHGGTLSVHSEGLGRGSEFEVWLPLAESLATTRKPVTAACGAGPAAAVTQVVIIEDQEDNRGMLSTLLELEGIEVWCAGTGPEGLALIDRVRPQAAIIDIGLPEMDGYEVAREIRNCLGSDIILIALTGYGQSQDVARAGRAGFDHHLVKPLQPDKLMSLLVPPAEPARVDSPDSPTRQDTA